MDVINLLICANAVYKCPSRLKVSTRATQILRVDIVQTGRTVDVASQVVVAVASLAVQAGTTHDLRLRPTTFIRRRGSSTARHQLHIELHFDSLQQCLRLALELLMFDHPVLIPRQRQVARVVDSVHCARKSQSPVVAQPRRDVQLEAE